MDGGRGCTLSSSSLLLVFLEPWPLRISGGVVDDLLPLPCLDLFFCFGLVLEPEAVDSLGAYLDAWAFLLDCPWPILPVKTFSEKASGGSHGTTVSVYK